MRRSIVTVVSTIVLFGSIGVQNAVAQCAFDAPAKAAKMQMSMVRAYHTCPGVEFLAPNTSSMAGIPTCTPPTAGLEDDGPGSPSYKFDSVKGACTVSFKAKLEEPCSDGSAFPCSDISVSLKCNGILTEPGSTPIADGGWSLNFVFRQTVNDESNGDMTMINFPINVSVPDASDGALKLKMSSLDLNESLFGPGSHELMANGCINLEILSVVLADPTGRSFATPGIGAR